VQAAFIKIQEKVEISHAASHCGLLPGSQKKIGITKNEEFAEKI